MTRATIATELGDIEIELFTTDAPKASQNFVDLAKKGYYDDVVFHRVIPGFVAQAGDGQFGKKASLQRGRVGTRSRTSRSRASTSAEPWRWRTPARTRTAASSSSSTRT